MTAADPQKTAGALTPPPSSAPHNFSTFATPAWDIKDQNQIAQACGPALVVITISAFWLHRSTSRPAAPTLQGKRG